MALCWIPQSSVLPPKPTISHCASLALGHLPPTHTTSPPGSKLLSPKSNSLSDPFPNTLLWVFRHPKQIPGSHPEPTRSLPRQPASHTPAEAHHSDLPLGSLFLSHRATAQALLWMATATSCWSANPSASFRYSLPAVASGRADGTAIACPPSAKTLQTVEFPQLLKVQTSRPDPDSSNCGHSSD